MKKSIAIQKALLTNAATNSVSVASFKQEVTRLTKNLWRCSLKSIRVISQGNEADNRRFDLLEKVRYVFPFGVKDKEFLKYFCNIGAKIKS